MANAEMVESVYSARGKVELARIISQNQKGQAPSYLDRENDKPLRCKAELARIISPNQKGRAPSYLDRENDKPLRCVWQNICRYNCGGNT